MYLSTFTQKSQEAVQAAQSLGVRSGHLAIGPLHLFLALLSQEEGLVLRVLERMEVPVGRAIATTEDEAKQVRVTRFWLGRMARNLRWRFRKHCLICAVRPETSIIR